MTLPLFNTTHHDILLTDATPARIQATDDRLILARLGDRAEKAGKGKIAEMADTRRGEIRRGPCSR